MSRARPLVSHTRQLTRSLFVSARQQTEDSPAASPPIKNVTIVGAGLMGAGIAQVAAQSNFNVVLVDQEDEYLEKALVIIRKSLDRITKKKFANEPKGAEKFVQDTMNLVKPRLDVVRGVSEADLVIEAIPENMEYKHKLFSTIDEVAPEHCLFASNTSSFSITEIGSVVKRQDKFGGLHFFNPVPMMQLVEVIRTVHTSEATFNALYKFGEDLGKTCVSSGDTPGFIVNRLLVPYMMDAVRMIERGEGTPEDIDTAMKLGAGYPMGPFQLADYVGLDTTKFIIDGWHEKEPENPLFEPSGKLNELVEQGNFGKKSGKGFYKYKK